MKNIISRREEERIAALKSYNILDTSPQKIYDDITLLASQICDTPISLISLIDEDRQWFKSKQGVDVESTPREIAFCARAIETPEELFIVSNAMEDERFKNNPLVTEYPYIRFYAGAPLVTNDGYALGTLCVIDREPRVLKPKQLEALTALRNGIVTAFELERTNRFLKESEEKQKQLLEETVEKDNATRSIIESAPNAMILIEANGVIRMVNIQTEKIFGYLRDEIIGKQIEILLPPEHSDIFIKLRETFITKPSHKAIGYGRTLYGIKKDGVRFPIEIGLNPLLNKGKLWILVSVIDISERKNHDEKQKIYLEELKEKNGIIERGLNEKHVLIGELTEAKEKLETLNATKDKFFSIIAHDLKGPLGSFKQVTELLAESYSEFPEEDKVEFILLMSQESKNLYSLLENLLEWSRSQRGNIPFNPEKFNLKMMSIEIIKLMKPTAEKKRIELINHIPISLDIIADENMINTVIRNLISNAIKFTPDCGSIELGIRAKTTEEFSSSEDCIFIKDSGLGMSLETRDKLFRIDTQVTTLGTNSEKGTGLGLILCKEFIEKHSGKIWVESEEGEGSTFYFTIPRRK
ncbi:MAG: PAS domain S-box protein [Candidatus Kapabacteria bacterium]|nr:PAS domain S-box protein [Candidatus Kapabacteria bacterium]